MAEKNARNGLDWTKIDVRRETRNRLQAHKYLHKYPNVDAIIAEWLDLADKTKVNKNLKAKKEQ